MIVLTIASLLVVALLGGTLLLYQTEAMWNMDSPNAQAWNATLNATATFGFNVIPLIFLVIVGFVIVAIVGGCKGFG